MHQKLLLAVCLVCITFVFTACDAARDLLNESTVDEVEHSLKLLPGHVELPNGLAATHSYFDSSSIRDQIGSWTDGDSKQVVQGACIAKSAYELDQADSVGDAIPASLDLTGNEEA